MYHHSLEHGQSLLHLLNTQSLSRNLTFPMGSTTKFSAIQFSLPLLLTRTTYGTDLNQHCAMRSTLSWGQQVGWTLKLKRPIYKNVCTISCCHHSPHSFKFSGYSMSVQQLVNCYCLCLIGTHHSIHFWKSEVWIYCTETGCSMGQKTTHWLPLLYSKTEGDDKNVHHYIFYMYIISILLVKSVIEIS